MNEFNCVDLVASGWQGLLIDGDPQKVAQAQSVFSREITVLCEYLHLENVYDIVGRHSLPRARSAVTVVEDAAKVARRNRRHAKDLRPSLRREA